MQIPPETHNKTGMHSSIENTILSENAESMSLINYHYIDGAHIYMINTNYSTSEKETML
jgi:hypothetical protein